MCGCLVGTLCGYWTAIHRLKKPVSIDISSETIFPVAPVPDCDVFVSPDPHSRGEPVELNENVAYLSIKH